MGHRGCGRRLLLPLWPRLRHPAGETGVASIATTLAVVRLALWGLHDLGALPSRVTLAAAAVRFVHAFIAVRRGVVAALLIGFASMVGAFTSQIDLSRRTWSGALAELQRHMSVRYPFTSWKEIDWSSGTTRGRLALFDGVYKHCLFVTVRYRA